MVTERLTHAFRYAAELHATQLRKGTPVPYISHLMGVAAIVLEHGGNETQVIAALLHDAIEDQPRGGATRQEIREQFGPEVLAIVEDCTDADTEPKPPWRGRKERYLARLPLASRDAKLVSLADKVHNVRTILRDFTQIGDELWKRFKGAKDGTLWYYRTLADTFTREYPGPLAAELEHVVSELERVTRGS
jgi:(p)ppGpp synthase/HD superfamily hydrolase